MNNGTCARQMHARMECAVRDDGSCPGPHLRIMLASPRLKDDVVVVITRDESAWRAFPPPFNDALSMRSTAISYVFCASRLRQGFVDRHREYKDVPCDIPILEIGHSFEFHTKKSCLRQFFILWELIRNIISSMASIKRLLFSVTLSFAQLER